MDRTSPQDFNNASNASVGVLGTMRYFYINRDVLRLLVSFEIKSRYRRSVLGLLWTLINPLLSSLVLWIVFVSVFKSRLINGTQFAPYLVAGVLVITFFNQGFMQAAESISNGTRVFLKIKVRPQIFALVSSLANSINFILGTIVLIFVSLISNARVSPQFPLFLLVGLSLIMMTTGLGLIFSNIFIRYNDSKYIISIFLQLLNYLTPVFYPKEALGDKVRFLISLNPLSSYLDVLRHVCNSTEIATTFDWLYMCISGALIFVLGLYIFNKNWHKSVVMM